MSGPRDPVSLALFCDVASYRRARLNTFPGHTPCTFFSGTAVGSSGPQLQIKSQEEALAEQTEREEAEWRARKACWADDSSPLLGGPLSPACRVSSSRRDYLVCI